MSFFILAVGFPVKVGEGFSCAEDPRWAGFCVQKRFPVYVFVFCLCVCDCQTYCLVSFPFFFFFLERNPVTLVMVVGRIESTSDITKIGSMFSLRVGGSIEKPDHVWLEEVCRRSTHSYGWCHLGLGMQLAFYRHRVHTFIAYIRD